MIPIPTEQENSDLVFSGSRVDVEQEKEQYETGVRLSCLDMALAYASKFISVPEEKKVVGIAKQFHDFVKGK